jgi:glutamine amidotransferase
MCLLSFYPGGIRPDVDALYTGAEFNPDGFGYAIVTGRHLMVGHGMNAEQVIERFDVARNRHPDGPALFHSRLGTGGTYSRYNCHPFRLRGDRRTVVAHNGIMPASAQPGKKDRRCDTRYAAEEWIGDGFGHLSERASRDRLGKYIGKWNKLVILTVNPAYGAQSYIINESSGMWDDGAWYSNSDYQYLPLVTFPRECLACGTPLAKDVDRCAVCHTCVDCGEDWLYGCQCYRYEPDNRDDGQTAAMALWSAELMAEVVEGYRARKLG